MSNAKDQPQLPLDAGSPQHIIALDIKDTMAIKAMNIRPNGEPVIIGGDNEQGKSTALRVVKMLLAGGREIPPQVVREGSKKAEIALETETHTIRRVMTTDGKRERFEVTAKDGSKVGAPQTFLSSLFGREAIDPLGLYTAGKQEQRDIVARVFGIDTADIDLLISALEAERAERGREVKRSKGAVESATHHADAPGEEVSVAELSEDLEKAREHNRKNADAREELSGLCGSVAALNEEIKSSSEGLQVAEREALASKGIAEAAAKQAADLRDVDTSVLTRKINELNEEIDRGHTMNSNNTRIRGWAEKTSANADRDRDSAESLADTVKGQELRLAKEQADCASKGGAVEELTDTDTAALKARIESAESDNRRARENITHAQLCDAAAQDRVNHEEAIAALDGARSKRLAMIEAAEFPVEGLGIDEDGLTYQGRPFKTNASSGIQLRVSVAVALVEAAKKQLRIMLIDDAEKLDDGNLAMVLEMASAAGVQPFVARRSRDALNTFIIEDGEIAEVSK